MFILWLSISFCSFVLFRLFSLYTKTYWKNDVVIAVAQGLLISILIKYVMA
ncbi:hypothetical protein [Paenibacillus hexagrammi]|uniref:Uncharacterized protein n=1 Tax=Paenibacillus hexagrammi TaxID=2908839 RepID=A0ABY3SG44_9BACL|nr:hypothetical protein [Paenibacillus sp. YPD9-1]UJF32947.1 hypothetical protein L0M14_25775 [Paenibacillus sp. YPD9-1]